MIQDGFYPLNSSVFDPNVRGESPEGFVIVRDIAVGAMVAGKKAVTLSNVPFGKNLGEVWGAEIIAGGDTGDVIDGGSAADLNSVLTVGAVVAGASEGQVSVTLVATDATSTASDYVVSLKVYGRILPKDPS